MGLALALPLVQAGLGLTAFAAVLRWAPATLPRSRALALAAIWVVFVSGEFWLFGQSSFLPYPVEADISVPLHWALTGHQGQFSHAFAGGNDVAGLAFHSGQILSLERGLLAALPLWPAQMLNRLLLTGLAVGGMYLLARRGFGASRPLALGLAAIQPVAHESIALFAWSHGLGYAILPLALYLCVFRCGRRLFWPGVFMVAALNAVSSSPTHSNMALLPALLLAGLMLPPRQWPRVGAAIAVIITLLLLNWHDSLFAKSLIAPLSFRGADFTQAASSLQGWLHAAGTDLGRRGWAIGLTVVAAALLLHRQGGRAVLPVTLTAAALLAGLVLNEVPWRLLHLGPLAGLNFNYAGYAFPVLACLLVARAGGAVAAKRPQAVLVAVSLAVAVSLTAGTKLRNLGGWLSDGALRELEADRAALSHRPWAPAEPFRVVSIPYRLSPNLPPAAGLDMLDGGYNLVLRSHATFWTQGVVPGYNDIESGYVLIQRPEIDFKARPSYALDELADAVFLRIANVRFVLSKVPLTAPGLTQVAGPAAVAPPRNTLPLAERLPAYLRLWSAPPPIFVYDLGEALPRVFAAGGLTVAAEAQLLAETRRRAPSRWAVARAGDLPEPAPPTGLVTVGKVRLGVDRMAVELSAPEAGLVIINQAHTPFWSAQADGVAVPLFPVNLVHMAAAVPAGTQRLELVYRRPTLAAAVTGRRP